MESSITFVMVSWNCRRLNAMFAFCQAPDGSGAPRTPHPLSSTRAAGTGGARAWARGRAGARAGGGADLLVDAVLDNGDEPLVVWQQRRRAALVAPQPLEALNVVLITDLIVLVGLLRPVARVHPSSAPLLAPRAVLAVKKFNSPTN
jgi:hypothetical protein